MNQSFTGLSESSPRWFFTDFIIIVHLLPPESVYIFHPLVWSPGDE